MHNMIIEDERANPVDDEDENGNRIYDFQGPHAAIHHNVEAYWSDFMAMHIKIRDENAHEQLQSNLVEHLCERK